MISNPHLGPLQLTLGQARLYFSPRFHPQGHSAPPFGNFNLGKHVGDDPQRVAKNRQLLSSILDAKPVFLQQVHGTQVVNLDGLPYPNPSQGFEHANGSEPTEIAVADASFTSRSGIACTVLVADCLSVLFSLNHGQVVGAAHAGWRGLAAGVLENSLQEMLSSLTTLLTKQKTRVLSKEGQALLEGCLVFPKDKPSLVKTLQKTHVAAWLGPCIGPQAFEVGMKVYNAFKEWGKVYTTCFTPLLHAPGQYLANLPALARLRLQALGVADIQGNDGSPAWCTFSNPDRFFSYRRAMQSLPLSSQAVEKSKPDRMAPNACQQTGRMAACIWKF